MINHIFIYIIYMYYIYIYIYIYIIEKLFHQGVTMTVLLGFVIKLTLTIAGMLGPFNIQFLPCNPLPFFQKPSLYYEGVAT